MRAANVWMMMWMMSQMDDVTKEEQKGNEEMAKDFIINISTPEMQCNGELTMRRELYKETNSISRVHHDSFYSFVHWTSCQLTHCIQT